MNDEMHGWVYNSMAYKQHVGDVEWLMKEALRRAVDIRDQGSGRGTMLVDVLNMLSDALGHDTYSEL
jgi:hypothetical protein